MTLGFTGTRRVRSASHSGSNFQDTGKPQPRNFLEQHALRALLAEPTWTVTMYAVYNELGDEVTEELREFLKQHLPEEQWA